MPPKFKNRANITLHYIDYPDPMVDFTYRLPLINVSLIHKNREFRTLALIDSGSSSDFLPMEIADYLGLNLAKKPTYAVGGGGIFSNATSLVGKCQLADNRNSVFDEFTNLEINVTLKPNTLPHMVLGRDSIFRRFDIKFMERNEKILLTRV